MPAVWSSMKRVLGLRPSRPGRPASARQAAPRRRPSTNVSRSRCVSNARVERGLRDRDRAEAERVEHRRLLDRRARSARSFVALRPR